MNKDRELMNKTLNEFVVPELRSREFKGSIPHFRRITNTEIHLLTFQFDRHGGGFVIEIAKTLNQPFTTHWGKVIDPKKITAHDLDKRVRIHPKGILENSSTDNWFRYDIKSLLTKNRFKKASDQVLKNS